MLLHSDKKVEDGNACFTYGELIEFVENFSPILTESCYAILCKSELSHAIALLSCFAAGKTAVPLSYKYGKNHCQKILRTISPEYVITDTDGELEIICLDDN